MNESTATTPAPKPVRAPKRITVPVKTEPKTFSRLVARSVLKSEATRPKLGGKYRVIHGSLALPRPAHEWQRPDGTEIPHEPKQVNAFMGDIVELTDVDAAAMLDLDVIEPIDAKPSRVGKVEPPQPTVPFRNRNA